MPARCHAAADTLLPPLLAARYYYLRYAATFITHTPAPCRHAMLLSLAAAFAYAADAATLRCHAYAIFFYALHAAATALRFLMRLLRYAVTLPPLRLIRFRLFSLLMPAFAAAMLLLLLA